jgi:4-hydroxy-2-oxoglutarate aldolase
MIVGTGRSSQGFNHPERRLKMQANHLEKLSGVFAPCMTIFDDDEEVAYDRIAENIERHNRTKLKGYMPLGSNG